MARLARGFLVLLALGLLWPAAARAQSSLATFERDHLVIETAEGARHEFRIELALAPEQQAQGLMYRRKLPADAGMLFVYQPARRISMWMANTYIPLDMLFVQADGVISKIVERTVPQSRASISSDRSVSAVLELNSGTAARLGLKPGDRVVHALIGP